MWELVHRVVTEIFGFFSSVILCLVHGEEVIAKVASYLGVKEWVERRGERRKGDTDMGLAQDVKLAVTFIPQLEKIMADAKAIEGNPAAQQLVTDITALIAMIKSVS
jgi:hypothetical protein